jgi:hypothetical protein
VPALTATINRLTFQQAKALSSTLATSVAQTLVPFVKQGANDVPDTAALSKVALLADDGKARTLLALATATGEALTGVEARVKQATLDLKNKKANQPSPAFGPGTLLMIGSLLENVVSYATILRTQYGFASVSVVSNAEAALQALVQGQLAVWKVQVVDTDALLPLPDNSSGLAGKLKRLRRGERPFQLAKPNPPRKPAWPWRTRLSVRPPTLGRRRTRLTSSWARC